MAWEYQFTKKLNHQPSHRTTRWIHFFRKRSTDGAADKNAAVVNEHFVRSQASKQAVKAVLDGALDK